MSTNRPALGVAQKSARTTPRPTGTGTAGSAAYVIALSSVAAVGGFLFGFDSGVVNGVKELRSALGSVRATEMGFVTSALYPDIQKAEHRPGT